jgi:UDP-2,3-diacylglucosamine pyrophosphatase LpxH
MLNFDCNAVKKWILEVAIDDAKHFDVTYSSVLSYGQMYFFEIRKTDLRPSHQVVSVTFLPVKHWSMTSADKEHLKNNEILQFEFLNNIIRNYYSRELFCCLCGHTHFLQSANRKSSNCWAHSAIANLQIFLNVPVR